MDEQELQEMTAEEETLEFSLEDIMKEFGGGDAEEKAPETEEEPQEAAEEVAAEEAAQEDTEEVAAEETVQDETAQEEAAPAEEPEQTEEAPAEAPAEEEEEAPQEASAQPVSGDTIRLDTIAVEAAAKNVKGAAPIEEDDPAAQEPFSEQWEPEYEQPMGEYVPPQPIIFHPRSRLRELKRKLVAGPEKRYYDLVEQGLGKLQAAIFLSLLVVIISAGATVMYAMGVVPESRMRLMVFGQLLVMLVSALLGSFQLIEGVADLFKKRFSLNTLLVITFIVCCVDAVFCLQQLRVPCCAAFSLEVTMSLWSTYQRRNTEMGQMDTMRKAVQLDSVGPCPDYYEGRKGLLRGEGQVEDFMETYDERSMPEKKISWYAVFALVAAVAIGVVAGVLHGISAGVQVAAVCLLAAVPVTMFVTVSRPFAVLERRLHSVGTVLCGWQGVEGLCGKALFPLSYEDLFPAGTAKMNGVKFFGNRPTDEIVAYCTALITASGSGLAPLFTQVLDSRNGHHYDAHNLRAYENGGIGGEVEGEPVLVGTMSFLKEMGVEVPEGLRVSQTVCVAVDGELCGLFALTYDAARSSAAGLSTLCSYRGLNPILTAGDFMLTKGFIQGRFGINPKRIILPEYRVREELRHKTLAEDSKALMLTTRDGLAPVAYGIAGARALRKACNTGVVVNMIGGIVGLAVMLTLTLLGRLDLLTPVNMFAYQLVWMIPGLLITEWTRSI